MSSKPTIVACPRCAKPVEWTTTARFRPFCSERCKTLDLGAWASEEYRVPGEPLPDGGTSSTLSDIADIPDDA